jgi:hypothetical protein
MQHFIGIRNVRLLLSFLDTYVVPQMITSCILDITRL